jgi:DNA-binding transcriptional regulator YdaS (Cro superfamily)
MARLLGVTQSAVGQWASGHRPVPLDRATEIERHLSARVTCGDLRPDVSWVRIADADWPHADGRPLLDVATRNQSQEPA